MILNISYFFLGILNTISSKIMKNGPAPSLVANSSIVSRHLENMIDINQLSIKNDERSKNILETSWHH